MLQRDGRLRARLRALEDGVRTLNARDWRDGLARDLRDLTGADIALSYRLEPREHGFSLLDFCTFGWRQPESEVLETFQRCYGQGDRLAFFDPSAPEPRQRNRTLHVGSLAHAAELAERSSGLPRSLIARLGLSVARRQRASESLRVQAELVFKPLRILHHVQVRTLLCDGPVLLANVGVFYDGVPPPAASAVLRALTPALRERLRLEQAARQAPAAAGLVEALLEAVTTPAFIVNEHFGLVSANGPGRCWLDERGRAALKERILAARAGVSPATRLTRVALPGQPAYLLVVLRADVDRVRLSTTCASQRWSLTPRERSVLGELLAGASNKQLSARLGISVRTAEVHVRRLLEKADADSRSHLVVLAHDLAG